MATPDTTIDPATLRAYRESDYRIDTVPPFILRVSQASLALQQAQQARGVEQSVFITAWNPRSRLLDEATNRTRQAALEQVLRERSLVFVPGSGSHPDCPADGEPGVLVFGLSLEDGRQLGRQWDQNAILHATADAVPQLILLR